MKQLEATGFISANEWRYCDKDSSDIAKMVAHAASLEVGHELSSSYDVYEGEELIILVGWGYHDCWMIFSPVNLPPVYHRCQQEDLYELRIMPPNWDIPF